MFKLYLSILLQFAIDNLKLMYFKGIIFFLSTKHGQMLSNLILYKSCQKHAQKQKNQSIRSKRICDFYMFIKYNLP